MASAHDRKPRTAGSWCDAEHLVAAINLGMYGEDHLTNVGYARSGAHVNQAHVSTQYQSALVLGPKKPGLPRAALLDLDAPHAREKLADYDTVVQNLRLIRAPGKSVWGAQPRRWSEAAVAADKEGHILFVFLRAARSMADFNTLLLSLPLGVVAAMHVEGGPEASLSLRGRRYSSTPTAATSRASWRTTASTASGRSRTSSAWRHPRRRRRLTARRSRAEVPPMSEAKITTERRGHLLLIGASTVRRR